MKWKLKIKIDRIALTSQLTYEDVSFVRKTAWSSRCNEQEWMREWRIWNVQLIDYNCGEEKLTDTMAHIRQLQCKAADVWQCVVASSRDKYTSDSIYGNQK